ncbi:MAG: succinylglutamate desuccinylase/aspartoacylase family protein [Microcoleaceae cyanobacterium]
MTPEILTLPLLQLASGDQLTLQVYRFQGSQPGKKAYLQANLHGAEISGNGVIYQLIEFLQTLSDDQLIGEIWLVPLCNPVGVNQRSHHFSSGRYHNYDGKDWNRIFWDYEKTDADIAAFARAHLELEPAVIKTQYRQVICETFHQLQSELKTSRLAPYSEHYRYQLQSLCVDADYVLDLHSSTNQALDYLYCFHSRPESARAFLLNWGILMTEYDGDAFDEAFLKPWLALEDCLADLGQPTVFDVEAWTLELGSGMEMNPDSVAVGVRGIKNYLATKGMLKIDGFPRPETATHTIQLTLKENIQKYYAPAGGMIQNRVALGTMVEAGETLYEILSFNKATALPQVIPVEATAPGRIFDQSTNQSVNQFDYVLSMMIELPNSESNH